jgi:hypothetical protein
VCAWRAVRHKRQSKSRSTHHGVGAGQHVQAAGHKRLKRVAPLLRGRPRRRYTLRARSGRGGQRGERRGPLQRPLSRAFV